MKALVLYNPYSGKGKFKKYLQDVERALKEKYQSVEIFASTHPCSIEEKISEVGSLYDFLLISGGDGTLHEAVNGLMKIEKDKRPKISYIPTGTVNDAGKMLGLKKRIKKSLDIALHGEEVKMDVISLNGNYFIYASAIGKFTSVSYKTNHGLKKRVGRIAYFLDAVPEIIERDMMPLSIHYDNKVIKGNYYVALFLNAEQVAGFRLHRLKRTKLNDGLIDVTLVEQKRFRMNLLRLAAFFILGDFFLSKYIHTLKLSSFSVNSSQPLSYNGDGELLCKTSKAEFKVVREAITINVTSKAKKKYFL